MTTSRRFWVDISKDLGALGVTYYIILFFVYGLAAYPPYGRLRQLDKGAPPPYDPPSWPTLEGPFGPYTLSQASRNNTHNTLHIPFLKKFSFHPKKPCSCYKKCMWTCVTSDQIGMCCLRPVTMYYQRPGFTIQLDQVWPDVTHLLSWQWPGHSY